MSRSAGNTGEQQHPGGRHARALYVVGVPIGNMGDLSLRGREALGLADLLFCEDRKEAGRLFRAHELPFPRDAWRPLNEHTTARELSEYGQELLAAERPTLIADAGMPVLADPGAQLLELARSAALAIEVVPGPTAATVALVAAGVGNTGYHFLGFPPRERAERRRFLQSLSEYLLPVVLYEAPYRTRALLADAASALPKRRELFVAVNLTGPGEFTRRFRVGEIPEVVDMIPKGPPVVILLPDPQLGSARRKAKKA